MRYFLGISIALAAFLLAFDTTIAALWITHPAVVAPPCYEHVAGFVLPPAGRWC